MKKFSRAIGSRLMSSVLLAVVVGSLCFSVGEGLRLTPFPVTTPAQAEPHLSINSAPDKASLSQYGPLDVPAQTQKRSKRQLIDFAGPIDAGTRNVLPELSSLLEYESTDVACDLFVTRPAGRAPPFLS
jgi:hypothetical protein